MSRMNKLTKPVNTIQDLASIVTENSTSFQREMADIFKEAQALVERHLSRPEMETKTKDGLSTAKWKLSLPTVTSP
jgi:hypothetical protein